MISDLYYKEENHAFTFQKIYAHFSYKSNKLHNNSKVGDETLKKITEKLPCRWWFSIEGRIDILNKKNLSKPKFVNKLSLF